MRQIIKPLLITLCAIAISFYIFISNGAGSLFLMNSLKLAIIWIFVLAYWIKTFWQNK